MNNTIPRRTRIDLLTPEELAIYNMIGDIEKLGAHPLLTDAVVLLNEARYKLADWVELQTADRYHEMKPMEDRPPAFDEGNRSLWEVMRRVMIYILRELDKWYGWKTFS